MVNKINKVFLGIILFLFLNVFFVHAAINPDFTPQWNIGDSWDRSTRPLLIANYKQLNGNIEYLGEPELIHFEVINRQELEDEMCYVIELTYKNPSASYQRRAAVWLFIREDDFTLKKVLKISKKEDGSIHQSLIQKINRNDFIVFNRFSPIPISFDFPNFPETNINEERTIDPPSKFPMTQKITFIDAETVEVEILSDFKTRAVKSTQIWKKGEPWWVSSQRSYTYFDYPNGEYKTRVETDSFSPPSDTEPPTVQIIIDPASNEAGWHNQDVTVTFTATDNEGGSGVKEIGYTIANVGAQSQGVIEEDTGNVVINTEGNTTLSYFAKDNAGNISGTESIEILLDKTTPDITAAWTPVIHEDDEHEDKEDADNKEYEVNFTATDNLDQSPSVVAVIKTPDMLDPKVKLKTKENKKNEIKYVFELEDNEVKIEALKPEEVWAEVQESGGIAVSNGQIIKVEYEDDEFTAKLKNGKLKIEAPEIILRVTATDAAGNQETVLISPPSIPEDDVHNKDD